MFKGSLFGQIIGIIGSLIVAKIYGSEAYGYFGIYISFTSIISIIYSLQLEKGIVISKTLISARNLMNSLLIIVLLVAIIVFSLGFYSINFFTNNITVQNIILGSILASILFSYNKVFESFLTFNKKFKPISNTKIIFSICNFIFQLSLFYKFKFFGLIYGNIIAVFIITIYYSFNIKRFKRIDVKLLKNSYIENKSILKFILPSTLINSIAINIIPLLIVAFFGAKEAGVYFLSNKILSIPLFLITSSISQIFYEKSSKLFEHSKEKLLKFTGEIVLYNISAIALFLICLNTFGIYLLELFLDKNWPNLRLFTLILSFLLLARSSFNPISNIIIVLNKNWISLIFNIYLVSINLIAIFYGFKLNSLAITLMILSFFGGIGYLILLFYFYSILKNIKKNHE